MHPILLFCRLPGEPYMCCGRLQCVSVMNESPLGFRLRLLDWPVLKDNDEFIDIVDAA